MKKSAWFGIVFAIIILGITTGIIVHVYSDERIEQATIEQVKEINRTLENQIVVQTVSSDEKVSPNASISFETYYNRCGHSKIEKRKINNTEVNKTENELKDLYPNWKIKKFNSEEILMYKEENSICDDHYMVRENGGYVAVYSIISDDKEELKEKTDISTQYLPEEDIQLLKKGIKANNSLELEQILSDYE